MKEFNVSTVICFGKGSLDKLKEVSQKRVFIICDKFIETCGIVDKVKEKLLNCEIFVFSDIIPDPTVEVIALGVKQLKNFKADLIIAVGGGSSIDGAKAIREYFKKLGESESNHLDFYAIPTTSGTGSEVTEYAVITNAQEELKYAIASKELLPTVAILDVELVKTVPKHITADTGMDVITHAIEAYVSKNSTDFTDALAEKAFSLAMEYLYRSYVNGEDLEAREKLHNASCLAGIAFNSAGLGITHSFAHAIGGKLHIPHGKINAIILPYVIKFNAELENKLYIKEYGVAIKKYQKLSKILELSANNPTLAVNNLVKNIMELQKKLLIPSNLIELGIDIDLIKKCKEDIFKAVEKDICTKSNPREILRENFETLFNEIVGIK